MQPSNQSWKKLYDAAIAFKAAQPWNILENNHIFGVKDPYSNRTGYCCIMGAGGELYGMALYLGTSGLDTLMSMFSGELNEDPLYVQHCLMLSFDNREDLHPEEKEQIKALGLKFRGRGAWPAFRLHEPGFYPWPLQEPNDILFLTEALEQALYIAQAASSDPDSFLETRDEKLLIRAAELQTDGSLHWRTEWRKPEAEIEENPSMTPQPFNELQLARVKKTIKGQSGTWEIGCFFMPKPVADQGRPYYPMIMLVLDQGSGQIIAMQMFEHTEAHTVVPIKFLELLDTAKLIPAHLLAADHKALDYLSPILQSFDLNSYKYDGPLMLDEVKASLFNSM